MHTQTKLGQHLQAGTQAIRDRFGMSIISEHWMQVSDYARFLARQLQVCEPIEEWADTQCPALLRPPATAQLLRRDLADLTQLDDVQPAKKAEQAPWHGDDCNDLGINCRIDEPTYFELLGAPFILPEDADPIGFAWAMAQSHLSNRRLLAGVLDRPRASGTHVLPCRFVSDLRMTSFLRTLLPRLEDVRTRAEVEPALRAARAVLIRFEQVFAPDPTNHRQAA